MNYQHFHHPSNDVGSCVSVWIDARAGLIKRVFRNGMLTSNGCPSTTSDADLSYLFQNEVKWLKALDHLGITPKLIDVDVEKREVVQSYTGPDLLIRDLLGLDSISNQSLSLQVLEIYQLLINDFGILKLNGARSNMCLNGQKLLFFDFKWATPLSQHSSPSKNRISECLTVLDDEFYSYRTYIAKMDSDLAGELARRLAVQIPLAPGPLIEAPT